MTVLLLFRRCLTSLFRAAVVFGFHSMCLWSGFWRVRHHGATMPGHLAGKERSIQHGDDREDHQGRNELAKPTH